MLKKLVAPYHKEVRLYLLLETSVYCGNKALLGRKPGQIESGVRGGSDQMGMSVKVIGHACLQVQHNAARLIVDPWLVGSCYWRSWWHFPESVPVTSDLLRVDWIYLSHEHFDHFHYPSMRKFDRNTPVLIPKFMKSRMKDSLESLGFMNVIELTHGRPYRLDCGLSICSYQYDMDDSAIVIHDGSSTLLNLNDSKVTGAALRKILKRYPSIDLVFRSHAPAQGYPICYEAQDQEELSFRRRDDYIRQFIDTIAILHPRYAIPFASNVCLLHKETYQYNAHAVTPVDVADECRNITFPCTQVVVMSPGDTWDSANGFTLHTVDAYEEVPSAVARLAEKMKPKLEAFYQEEESVKPDYNKFSSFMTGFLRALPWGIGFLFCPVIVFEQPQAVHRYWVVDFKSKAVTQRDELPLNANSIIRVHPAVLMDALSKGILNLVHISKRLHIWVRKGGMKEDFKFWGLIQLYEMGYLPLRNLLTRRSVAVLWRRRAEVMALAKMAIVRQRFEEKVMPKMY